MGLSFGTAGPKDELRVLIDDGNDIGKIPVTVLRVQMMTYVLGVVLLDIRRAGFLQEVVSVGHLLAEGAKHLVSSLGVLDYGTVLLLFLTLGIRGDGQVMREEPGVLTELGLLGVDENELEVRGSLGIKQRSHKDIESYGLTLSCRAGNQKMRGVGKVEHLDLSGHLSSYDYREGGSGLFELRAVDKLTHGHRGALFVRDLHTHTVLQERGYHLPRLERYGDIVRETAYGSHLDALCGVYLIKGHGWPGDGIDALHLYMMVGEGLLDDGYVSVYLPFRDRVMAARSVLQEIRRRELVIGRLIDAADLCPWR